MELWKPVVEFPNEYEVSSEGRVRSLGRYIKCRAGALRFKSAHIITRCSVTNSGYKTVIFGVQGKKYTRYIHRVVAEAFIPNPYNKETVNHKDEDKFNNNVQNLEWATQAENTAYNDGYRRRQENFSPEGRRRCLEATMKANSIPVFQIDDCDNVIKLWESSSTAARELGLDRSTILKCAKGKCSSAGGFIWVRQEDMPRMFMVVGL